MSQQFCLKWNNHTTNLLTVFKSFQSSETLVDVTLSCEGHNLKAHKMVLSACSPYFQTLFTENPCKHPIVIINGMKYTDVKAILDFMYKGEVNVSHDGLSSFLKAAETLKVKGLAEVCGENRATPQEATPSDPTPAAPPRADTPTKKRNRARKRSLSDSNRSDDEGVSRKIREPTSPEVHELSGDESFTGDMKSSDGPTLNSLPQVPPNVYSRSQEPSASSLGGEVASDDEYEVEPSKLLEQTLTTDSVPLNNQLSISSESGIKIEKRRTSTPLESSSLQGPDSPPDIKPIIQFDDSGMSSSAAGPSDGAMMLYNDQSVSQPGPSNFQDGTLLQHDNSQAQDIPGYEEIRDHIPIEVLPFLKQRPELSIFESKNTRNVHYRCEKCPFMTDNFQQFQKHAEDHKSAKQHRCSQCGKLFQSAARLQNHMQCHEVGQPYTCMYCEKKFKHSSSLKTHMKTHFNFERFSCPICERQFNSNANMKKHLATHH